MLDLAGSIDRVVTLPPGPELAVALAELPLGEIPNARVVEVVRARGRQLGYGQAELLEGLVQIARSTPVDALGDGGVERTAGSHAWGASEIAAAFGWTRRTAVDELRFAETLIDHLPDVFAALREGRLDRGKAWVFAQYLDPALLSGAHLAEACAQVLPDAAGLTTRQLADRLRRAILVIDPEYQWRRYRRAVRDRGLACYLDPASGTATLAANGLPPDEAAAACARLDRLAAAARRSGCPGRLNQISSDLCIGMLDGRFEGLTEAQILAALRSRADVDDDDAGAGGEGTAAAARDTGSGTGAFAEPAEPAAPAAASPSAPSPIAETGPLREGIEIRVGLLTLLGRDEQPGEIPGLGSISADIARRAVFDQQRGASWRFAIVETDGRLLLGGVLRRRPALAAGGGGRVRGGVVELRLTRADLVQELTGDGPWTGVLAEIAARWADRHARTAPSLRRPRFARGALARHVQLRDRYCIGPGCDRPALRCNLDHTHDHHYGGRTVDGNIGPLCPWHDRDKVMGWQLSQPSPGQFVWRSPLGCIYRTRGDPVRHTPPIPRQRSHHGESWGTLRR